MRVICRPDHGHSHGHGHGHGTPPPTPTPRPERRIPHIFFVDPYDYDDYVDMDDLFDDDMDTGELMISLPSNWTKLTLDDVNDGESVITAGFRHVQLASGEQ